MWKAFSRSVTDVVERRVGLLVCRNDKSDRTNTNTTEEDKSSRSKKRSPCFLPFKPSCPLQCVKPFQAFHRKNENRDQEQKFEQPDIPNSWVGWSTGLLIGWYLCLLPVAKHTFLGNYRRRHCTREDSNFNFSQAFLVQGLAQQSLKPLSVLPENSYQVVSTGTSTTSDGEHSSLHSGDEFNSISSACSLNDALTIQPGSYSPEEALNEASRVFAAAGRALEGEIENKLGLHCVERGQHYQALKHFRRASHLSNASASYNLAQCYELGLGTRNSLKKAAKWYRIASEQGHVTAMYNLAIFLGQGLGGLAQDKDTAYQLLSKASAMGLQQATEALKSIDGWGAKTTTTKANDTHDFLSMLGVQSASTQEVKKQKWPSVETKLSHLDWLDLSSSSFSSSSSGESSPTDCSTDCMGNNPTAQTSKYNFSTNQGRSKLMWPMQFYKMNFMQCNKSIGPRLDSICV